MKCKSIFVVWKASAAIWVVAMFVGAEVFGVTAALDTSAISTDLQQQKLGGNPNFSQTLCKVWWKVN